MVWFVLIVNPVYADIFDEVLITNVNELPNSDGLLKPEIMWANHEHLSGWIDIIGFPETVKIDNVFYTNKNNAEPLYSYGLKPLMECNYASCSVDSIDKSISIQKENGFVTLHLHTVMHWTEIYCTKDGCQDHHYTEYADFYDTDTAPILFSYPDLKFKVEKQKNINIISMVQNGFGIISSTISTDNGSITNYKSAGIINYTQKNVPYMELIPVNIWKQEGHEVSRYGNDVLVENVSNYSIRYSTPFVSYTIENLTKSEARQTIIEPYVGQLLWFFSLVIISILIMKRHS
jgi:hypothetical protein